ncbi:Solute carrier organic anion transporter family member 2B1 [Tupaia chinensis]|uniref:Solute carrier organic anion transporter family member n=1 Tax=Tupaia chinensis TaxID=246437 RepID=L9L9W1_TUPCH|nr:Solute carrier organic anion transporter family member 2B1 [Tupaia chinensis]
MPRSADEGPQMPDKDPKAVMGTEATPGGKASPDLQDSRPSGFHNIKSFVLCHSLLQLAQLMISGYLKSSISTVEKRFGLTSQTSGLLAAFNEVGNTALIVFVSYFGSRVHRPRMIGCGAVLVALAGLLMTLPHFISEPYHYDHIRSEDGPQDSKASLCLPTTSVPALAPSNGSCQSHAETHHLTVVGIMFAAQTLLGVGSVPIQPFGISYIDDFSHSNNSPLYLGILFAVTMMGPGLAYGLGGLMLRLYVDIDRMPEDGISLTPKDPRWVGAWWLGFLISACVVALAAIPYFFFPREMPKEKHELRFRQKALAVTASATSKGEDSPSEQSPGESPEKQGGMAQMAPDLSVLQFIKEPQDFISAWIFAMYFPALPTSGDTDGNDGSNGDTVVRVVLAAVAVQGADSPSEQSPGESPEKQGGMAQMAPDLSVLQFIKEPQDFISAWIFAMYFPALPTSVFPRVLLRTLRHPIFLLVVLSQVCMSSMVAGMATFLPKFLERQFSVTASFANLLIGSLSVPSAIMGILVGGILVKRLHLGPLRCGILCLLGALFTLILSLPLFFIGCPTHQIVGIAHQPTPFSGCSESCSCSSDNFNPVCDPSTRVEYITPCHAGCASWVVQEAVDKSQVFYTNCSCVAGGGPVLAGSCDSACGHLVLPFLFLVSLGAALSSVTHTPAFMLILRGVKKEDKTLAVGIQFMLLRVLAWMPSPVLHGSAIDTTCVYWDLNCGRRAVCRYYNHDLLRSRFIGLQFFFKMGSLICFALVLAVLRQQDKEAESKAPRSSPGLEQQLLVAEPEKKLENSRV